MATALRDAGYETGLVGKWMLGDPTGSPPHRIPTTLPRSANVPRPVESPRLSRKLRENHEWMCRWIQQFGFDHVDRVFAKNLESMSLPRPFKVHNMEWICEGALRFLENASSPFFLFVATTLPHGTGLKTQSLDADPRLTPAGLLEKAPEVQPHRDTIAERVAGLPFDLAGPSLWIDDSVGAIRQKLDDLGDMQERLRQHLRGLPHTFGEFTA